MSLRRFYNRIEGEEAICQYFFILNLIHVEEDCLICLEAIKHPEENVECHECNKILHLSCIERWFAQNDMRKCPHCRTNWKFEIDIVEKPKPIIVELDDYSIMPTYNQTRTSRDRITTRGSITGNIETWSNNITGTINFNPRINNTINNTVNNTNYINRTINNISNISNISNRNISGNRGLSAYQYN
jgi:hypothetical protein